MVLPDSDGVPRAPPYSGSWLSAGDFVYKTVTFSGAASQLLQLSSAFFLFYQSYYPNKHARWFGLFPVRSPLLRKSIFLSLPVATEMFQFTTSSSTGLLRSSSCD